MDLLETSRAEEFLQAALTALQRGRGFEAVLDRLPVPVYTTDREGRVTYWNQACVDFAGREPQLGDDRWCVSWQLYSIDGALIPHSECPMARALNEKQPIRHEVAVAMRPDGSRVAFTPYPTPLLDDDGNLKGAVNLLIDISDKQSDALREQAARCRRLANATNDRGASDILRNMASRYEETSGALRREP